MYMDPKKVDSPKASWRLIDVLFNEGDDGASLAVGWWDDEPALGIRWNGSKNESGVGHPQSRGLPTWFILPEWAIDGVLESDVIPADKVTLAKALLQLGG